MSVELEDEPSSDVLNPNAKIESSNPLWYWMSMGLLAIAVILAVVPFGPVAIIKSDGRVLDRLALQPGMTGTLIAVAFMAALFLRGCLKLPDHPLIYLLLIGDLIVFASYLQIVFTGEQVVLFQMPSWWPFKDPTVSPRFLAVTVIVLTFIGARAIAGMGVILLAFVTLLHMTNIEEDIGWRAVVFIVASFMSLLLQIKIPGMRVDKINGREFLGQIGNGLLRGGVEVKENLAATGKTVEAGARLAAKGVVACATGGVAGAVGAAAAVGQVQEQGVIDKEKLT